MRASFCVFVCARVCVCEREIERERERVAISLRTASRLVKCPRTSMSPAESDLLFPQLDSATLAGLSDYEDFSRDDFLFPLNVQLNDMDGFGLADDFDCKIALKPLSVRELNDFTCSLSGITEEDEEAEKGGSSEVAGANVHDTDYRRKHQSVPEAEIVLANESMQLDINRSEQETLLTSNEDCCEYLKDAIAAPGNRNRWRASPIKDMASIGADFSEVSITLGDSSNAPVAGPAQGNTQVKDVCVKEMSNSTPLACTQGILPAQCSLVTAATNSRHVERRTVRTPSVFSINSPLSSPTASVSNPDERSIFKTVGHEEKGSMCEVNTAKTGQPAFVCAGTPRLCADGYLKPVSQPVVQNGPPFTAMHRSQSSHALGQFRFSGQGGYPTEVFVSPFHMSAEGYACPSNSIHYHPSCAFGRGDRPPTMPMRRVLSAGDIQALHGMQSYYGDNNLSSTERSSSEESTGLKVGHYTLEERKLRVHRYRQKRNERNFSKKIKYACRKTLADSRPRIRGRFARMLDDSGEPFVKDHVDEYEAGVMPTLHCGMPHGNMVSFWNATGINVAIQHGH